MAAGDSARHEAETSRRHADRLRAAAREQERRARSFDRGGNAEQRTADLLDVLRRHGFDAAHDLSWPGTRSANIDHVVIGPPGVFVIDTKDWSDPVSVVGGRLRCGPVDRQEALDKVRTQADAVRDALAAAHLAPSRVTPVIALHAATSPLATIDGTWVVGSERLPRELLARPGALSPGDVGRLLSVLAERLPRAGRHRTATPCPAEPAAAPEHLEPEALFSGADLAADALRAAEQKPLEDWLVFLHPEQLRHVRRTLNGPGRITGPAGTGKTVLALHRLAYLAEHGGRRLLYTTFNRSIPAIVGSVYRRLSPYTADRVEFTGLHQWAGAFLRSRQIDVPLDGKRARTNLARTWSRCDRNNRALLTSIADHAYWRDEIEQVIRGRGLTSLDQYLQADRPGRGIRLSQQHRRIVWAMAEDYRELLRTDGKADFDDLLRLARDEARREPPAPGYDVVVLDEAQDLSQVAAELLHALVGDRPNGLLFLGDDNQRVYAGGFRPSDCGIDVVGRSVRLNVNYRNTAEILSYATGMTAPEDVGLLDDLGAGSTAQSVRSGPEPVVTHFIADDQHNRALVAAIRTALADDADDPFLAVLTENTTAADFYLRLITTNDLPAAPLKDWAGDPARAVLVGTIKRAKGLEFNRVFLPAVAPELLAEPADASEADLVRWRRRRRELVVGLTRSRRHLWVGAVMPPGAPGADVFRDPVAVDPDDTSVAGVVEAAIGVLISGESAKFAAPGWIYEGRMERLVCDVCDGVLHACRKSLLSDGRHFRDWAFVCPACLTAVPGDRLSPEGRRLLAELRHVR